MATVTFDTLKYVRQLEAAGIALQQAEALVTAQRDILSDVLDTQFAVKASGANKSDIADLGATNKIDNGDIRTAIAEARTSIIIWSVSAIFLAQLLPPILKLFIK